MDGVPEAKEGHSTPLFLWICYIILPPTKTRRNLSEDLDKPSINYFIYLPVVYILIISILNYTPTKISHQKI